MALTAKGGHSSPRSDLIAHLPQLRRFAVVLTGEAQTGDALIATVCGRLMARHDAVPADRPFARWVLGELYAHWLDEVRQRRQAVADLRADTATFRAHMIERGPDGIDADAMAGFLADLPPQQRVAILLVYGEGYSYAEAAQVLDVTAETVATRVAGILGSLVDRLDLMGAGRLSEPRMPPPDRQREQASR